MSTATLEKAPAHRPESPRRQMIHFKVYRPYPGEETSLEDRRILRDRRSAPRYAAPRHSASRVRLAITVIAIAGLLMLMHESTRVSQPVPPTRTGYWGAPLPFYRWIGFRRTALNE